MFTHQKYDTFKFVPNKLTKDLLTLLLPDVAIRVISSTLALVVILFVLGNISF